MLNVITRLDYSGPTTAMLSTIKHLDKKRFDIHIATGLVDESIRSDPDYIDPEIKLIVFSSLVRNISIWKDIVTLIRLYLLIRRQRYDIVHCHTSKAGFIGRVASKMANVKIVIYSPHGNIFFGYFGKLSTGFFIILEKIAAKFTDKIVTLTKRGIEPYINLGIGRNKQFIHIYNGIDVDKFNKRGDINITQKKKELGLLDNHLVGTIVGRLVPVKGHIYLIKSICKVVNEFSNARFLFVGDGILMDELINQAKLLGITNYTYFLGMRYDVAQILACGDLLLLSSINEGFGIAILEAMAMKKPVIATNVDGIPEIVDDGETGILVPPGDPDSFALAMIKLFSKRDLAKKMGLKGFEKVKRDFDIRVTAKKMERLYYEELS